MKINANKYEANEIMKIIREWTNLSQEKFAKELGRSRNGINNIEHNRNRIYLNDFLDICEKFKITMQRDKIGGNYVSKWKTGITCACK